MCDNLDTAADFFRMEGALEALLGCCSSESPAVSALGLAYGSCVEIVAVDAAVVPALYV